MCNNCTFCLVIIGGLGGRHEEQVLNAVANPSGLWSQARDDVKRDASACHAPIRGYVISPENVFTSSS